MEGYFATHYSPADVAALIHDPNVRVLLAGAGGDDIGVMITRNNRADDRFYVSSLYVLPSHQGTGVGSVLLDVAEREAGRVGKDRLWLGVMTHNIRSVQWYERHGFRFEFREPFTMGGTTVEHRIGFRVIGGTVPTSPAAVRPPEAG
jgi:ribosomal protein S18 acetylase RimI-like enzyme